MRRQNPRIHRIVLLSVLFTASYFVVPAQVLTDTTARHADSIPQPVILDTALRIKNLNPFFNLHVDSTLTYNLELNRDENQYYWFLRNSPLGLKINKDDGLLTFKADKSFFLYSKI